MSAYLFLSSRTIKQYYGLDHNVSPREDLAKYAPKMIAEGKITQERVDMIKRWESASANALENFPLFVAGVLIACHGGVENKLINR